MADCVTLVPLAPPSPAGFRLWDNGRLLGAVFEPSDDTRWMGMHRSGARFFAADRDEAATAVQIHDARLRRVPFPEHAAKPAILAH